MDALAFHPYPIAPLGSPGERFSETMARLRRAMRTAGEGGEPVWVTEVGLPIGPEIRAVDVARTIDGIYARLSGEPEIEAVVFHTLLEGESAAGGGDGFGWLVPAGGGELEARPVYERFSARADG
jgi:hypothetical protein